MNSRYAHRKRPSALRLSTDSTITPLPLYSTAVLQDIPSDRPPDYPDSAEEADIDVDSDSDESIVNYPPQLAVSPRRRTPRSPPLSRPKRPRTTDSHLDSLLERSVFALEMSNALLQSSITTQATLNNVLGADETHQETSLEAHAQNLSSRISHNTAVLDDLDVISRGVDSLLLDQPAETETTSRSLPTSSHLSRRSHLRKPSLDLRSASLHFHDHGRNDLVAPAPRAITMYVDSSESPTSISMSSTLGMRYSSRLPVTPLPQDIPRRPLLLQSHSELEGTKRAVDVLSSLAASASNSSPSSSLRTARRPRSSSNSTTTTSATPRTPRAGPSRSRSPSHSPARSFSSRRTRLERDWTTPPIIELPSSSSESSDEREMQVDQTVSRLRNILQNNPPQDKGKERERDKLQERPSFLTPRTVAPVADTSHATASVSRLFTKARHIHSTRPPSPPRHSALKGSMNSVRRERDSLSIPSTPVSPVPSLSGSWLSVSDALSFRASGSSGRSTPNRVSFAELPPDAGQRKKMAGSRSRSRSKSRKGKGKDTGKGDGSDADGPWWTWLLGVHTGYSTPGTPSYIRNEERLARGAGWTPKPGFGGSIEEWGV